jgi:hypothetical protein
MSIGSSHFFSQSGTTGLDGPQGPMGPTGQTGDPGTSVTGNTGNTGTTLTSFILNLSQNSVTSDIITINTGTIGFTFDASLIRGVTVFFGDGITATPGSSLFLGISNETNLAKFTFRNIESTTAGISLTSDANFITINATAGDLPVGNPNSVKGILYLDTSTTTKFTDYGFTGNTQSLYLHLNPGTGSTNSVLFTNRSKTSSDSILDVNSITVVEANNITGFTGFNDSSNSNEISTFALIVSDGLTGFPSSVKFRQSSSVLYPGKNIIVCTKHSSDSGITAEVFHAGYESSKFSAYTQGACHTNTTCLDYINYKDCQNPGSTFYAYVTCQQAAPSGTSFESIPCCIQGLCTNVPLNLCLKWGGTTQQNCGTLCDDPCSTQ